MEKPKQFYDRQKMQLDSLLEVASRENPPKPLTDEDIDGMHEAWLKGQNAESQTDLNG